MKKENRIKELRITNNLTQSELAHKIQTTNKNIWAYENGIANPPIEILERLADLFETSIDYIVGREDDFGIKPQIKEKNYTEEEKQLIEDFRSLTPELKKMITETMNTFKRSEINKSTKRKKA